MGDQEDGSRGKKKNIEQTAIVDADTGKIVGSRQKVREVTLKYCIETLKKNNIPAGYKDTFMASEVERKLNDSDGTFTADKEAFDALVVKLKKSRKRNYDFLVRSGKKFQNAVYKFSREMIEKEKFPDSFKETTLHMIFKGGQGNRHILSDNRFIHSKFWFPRVVEGLIVFEGLKSHLISGSSQ